MRQLTTVVPPSALVDYVQKLIESGASIVTITPLHARGYWEPTEYLIVFTRPAPVMDADFNEDSGL